MLEYNVRNNCLTESEYNIKDEANNAALFTTGNGYFGIRGSFEEFGSLNVQGGFIRGLFDEIVEIPSIYVDNIYMRKYYINELEAKQFEFQDSCINFADILLLRFKIGESYFYPWEGEILTWERYIDTNDGSLIRIVIWQDEMGNQTKFNFKRFASFSNNHHYFITVKVEKLNHDLPITVESGIDTWIKTNGQKKSKLIAEPSQNQYLFSMGEKYNHQSAVSLHTVYSFESEKSHKINNGCYYESQTSTEEKIIEVVKYVSVHITPDLEENESLVQVNHNDMLEMKKISFEEHYQEHLKAYKKSFDMININLSHKSDDALLKYANYQTLIGIDRYDQVHSLSAKNLTGEKYNQFVWWDAEIFQFPVYLMTDPKAAKNTLMYRYNRLEESKKNAQLDGLEGAKFAFCSSVKGDEKVWAYARHPFMQIHINSDIAYAILMYYRVTKDTHFMIEYGVEMLVEIAKYFISRVIYDKETDEYHLNQVTGTDEHHPYVNNNSYTNFIVSYILEETIKWLNINESVRRRLFVDETLINRMKQIASKIRKVVDEDGYIPQFDGYFDLKPTLEVTGNGAAKNFQMKQSGLYHESQIIKQPDVIMLFTYIDIPIPNASYEKNWVYYEKMCEASSSLTYPVHAIAAIDHKEYEKFHDYWYKSVAIDIIDNHNEAKLGLHAACMAGGWYSIFRGLFGFKPNIDYLEVNPKYFEAWGEVEIHFIYQGNKVYAKLSKDTLVLKSDGTFQLIYNNKVIHHDKLTLLKLDV